MAKICGFVKPGTHQAVVEATLKDMAQALHHGQQEQLAVHVFDGGGLAVVSATSEAEHLLARDQQREMCLALGGSIIDDRHNGNGRKAQEIGAAALLQAYRDEGLALAPRLNGDFAFACYDERQSALTIVGSRFGFCPLYYYGDETGIWFASEVKALLSAVPHRTFDWKGAAGFFYLGYMVGDRTLLEGVNALAAGEALTYAAGRLKRTKYYDFTKAPVLDEREVSTATIAELFDQAVRRRLADEPSTVLLSGGLDSRLMLGTLHSLGARPDGLSIEHGDERGGADGRYAKQIANQLGLDCEVRPTRTGFYASPECLEAFYILDGMVPTWNLWIPHVYPELTPSLNAVWDGLAVGVALGAHQQQSGRIDAHLAQLLTLRTKRRHLLRRILTPDAYAILDGDFLPRLHTEFDNIPAQDNQYLSYRLQHHVRRRVAPNTHQLWATRVKPRTPGTDREFLDYVLAIPIHMKRNFRLYMQMYKNHYPELLTVPLISGGAMVDLDPAGRRASTHELISQMRGTIARTAGRYNLKRPLQRLAGQPSTPLEREISEVIVRVLADSRFERPFYNTGELQRMFARYRAGNMAHHELFLLVFYIELWHLLFIDQNAPLLDVNGSR